ncbi:unnamed protein product [Bursaphelenchus okinawaensis]|uniref:C3H1-type domain-containing protein n=1 Tax=Bursaphelenchus okinawaensis TaxID=465554 RepID=A0A811JW89_9BILA|nr:unnamed protein product [Bursaphelenchus okinawaensis]CAG9086599.1 unnamed protein product [Bursaphelenchus okinawaensis]
MVYNIFDGLLEFDFNNGGCRMVEDPQQAVFESVIRKVFEEQRTRLDDMSADQSHLNKAVGAPVAKTGPAKKKDQLKKMVPLPLVMPVKKRRDSIDSGLSGCSKSTSPTMFAPGNFGAIGTSQCNFGSIGACMDKFGSNDKFGTSPANFGSIGASLSNLCSNSNFGSIGTSLDKFASNESTQQETCPSHFRTSPVFGTSVTHMVQSSTCSSSTSSTRASSPYGTAPTPLATIRPIPLVQPKNHRKPLELLSAEEKCLREQRLQVKARTSMCHDFTTKGECRYGNNCRFAHDKAELRPIETHPKYKTKICRNFVNHGHCAYGWKCQFKHDPL